MSTILAILLSARDAGDFSYVAGEREMAPKCGSISAGVFREMRKTWYVCTTTDQFKSDYRKIGAINFQSFLIELFSPELLIPQTEFFFVAGRLHFL